MNHNPKSLNWHPFFLFAMLALVLPLLAGCGQAAAASLSVPEGARAGDLVGLAACEYQPADAKTTYAAECGTLVVPENRQKAGSRLIALPVVRVPATGAAAAEPIFYLQGGPGQSNLSWGPPAWLLTGRDVVFVGYRGVDGTVSLACPEVSRSLDDHVGQDMFSERARVDYAAAVRQCAGAHAAAGADLSGYTIPEVIADLEAARAALGYDRVNLLSESYGTRVAQLYAYLHPERLRRLVLIGVNTPGRFVWEPADLDRLIWHVSDLCAADPACASRTDNLAQTIHAVNRDMPERWLFFNIDPDTVRVGAQFLLLDNPMMAMVFDAYLDAAEGDAAGLAMLNLLTSLAPIDGQIFGDQSSKAGTADLDRYPGLERVGLGDSIMGAPMSEMIWPMAAEWPLEPIPADLRRFQPSDVEMLLVNGAVDFSTPPAALDDARPYYPNAQMVVLPEFGHISDVMARLQPAAFERLITSYYDTGSADASLYVYEPLPFEPRLSLGTAGRLLVAAMVILPALILLGAALVVRRYRRRALRQAN